MKTSIEFTLIAGLTLLVSTLTNFGQSNKKEKTPKHNQLTQKENEILYSQKRDTPMH